MSNDCHSFAKINEIRICKHIRFCHQKTNIDFVKFFVPERSKKKSKRGIVIFIALSRTNCDSILIAIVKCRSYRKPLVAHRL